MLPWTGKASCKFFRGGGEDPALGLALLHGLHLRWARDLGDAFATVGSCLVLTGDRKLPSERRWAQNHGVHLLGATLISPPPSPRPREAEQIQPHRSPMASAKGRAVPETGGTAEDGTEGTLPVLLRHATDSKAVGAPRRSLACRHQHRRLIASGG